VARERVSRAVRPFVVAAKQDLRVEAAPMVGEMAVALRVARREEGRRVVIEGPERTREGRLHSDRPGWVEVSGILDDDELALVLLLSPTSTCVFV
jgi:hypothetical protein